MSMSAEALASSDARSGTPSAIAEVLVVDDNPIDRLRAGRLVDQNSRCRAIYAEDGAGALARLADHTVSVVLTDLQMEGMEGLELVRAIREHHPEIPVIVMTGHGSEDAAVEALRVGATDYLPKHRLAQDLRAILARACARRPPETGSENACKRWCCANRDSSWATIRTSFPHFWSSFRTR